jgi:hypothetical protein
VKPPAGRRRRATTGPALPTPKNSPVALRHRPQPPHAATKLGRGQQQQLSATWVAAECRLGRRRAPPIPHLRPVVYVPPPPDRCVPLSPPRPPHSPCRLRSQIQSTAFAESSKCCSSASLFFSYASFYPVLKPFSCGLIKQSSKYQHSYEFRQIVSKIGPLMLLALCKQKDISYLSTVFQTSSSLQLKPNRTLCREKMHMHG